MSNLTSLIRLHLGTYINLIEFICNPDKALLQYQHPNINAQLSIFPNQARGA